MTMMPELQQKKPQKRLRDAVSVIAALGVLAGFPLLTPALNGFKIGSLPAGYVPAGYVIVAHGIALMFLIWAAVVVWTSRNDG